MSERERFSKAEEQRLREFLYPKVGWCWKCGGPTRGGNTVCGDGQCIGKGRIEPPAKEK